MKRFLAVLVLAGGSVNGQTITGDLTNGLKAYYQFAGNGLDVSGNNNHLNVSSRYSFDENANYINLNIPKQYSYVSNQAGVTDRAIYFEWGTPLVIPNSQSWETTSYTISTWAKLGQNPNGYWPHVTGKRADYSLGANRWAIFLNTDESRNPKGWIGNTTAAFTANEVSWTPSAQTSFERWFHLAMVVDLNTVQFYVDGSSVGQSSGGSNMSGSTRPIFIGGSGYYDMGIRDNWLEQTFEGSISDYMYYERPLSPSEISQIYTIQSVPEPSSLSLLFAGGAVALARRRKS